MAYHGTAKNEDQRIKKNEKAQVGRNARKKCIGKGGDIAKNKKRFKANIMYNWENEQNKKRKDTSKKGEQKERSKK